MGMSGQTPGVFFFVSLDSIWSARTLDLKIFFSKIWKNLEIFDFYRENFGDADVCFQNKKNGFPSF